ncbi:MAG: branched-chain amino acid ABC transporter permease [Anaerolineales bacterium]|nr:branched-chain amino acid ABC transporter permease [Anaerolineales bacterium]
MKDRLKNLDLITAFLWLLRAAIILVVAWGTFKTLLSNPYTSRNWLDFIIFGIAQGSMYALIAIGYTLVYGVLKMINFAHGEFFMSGIFTATSALAIPLAASGFMDKHPLLSLLAIGLLSMLVSVGIALLTERIAYRPLRHAPRLMPLITAIGASFFWQYYFRGLFGSQVRPFPTVVALQGSIPFLNTTVLKTHVLVVVVTVLALVALNFFITKTRAGMAIRSVSENKDVAALMGINVDRAISMTFATGATMAGLAGLLYALVYGQVHFFMGFIPGIKAFTAAVLGGIGNIPGAAVGGLLLGLFESVGPSLFLQGLGIPAFNQLKDVIAFTMLVLVLIFRPQGIMGERLAEKKA